MLGQDDEIYSSLDILSQRMNSKHLKNIPAGINVVETFHEEFMKNKEKVLEER